MSFDEVKRFGITEEAGDANQQVAEKRLDLPCIALQEAHEFIGPVDLVDGHSALDPTNECLAFVLRKIVAGLSAHEQTGLLQLVARKNEPSIRWQGAPSRRMWRVRDEVLGHIRRLQDVVHAACGDGTCGHAAVLRRFRVLGDDQAACGVDRLDARDPVAPGAGQDDADGALPLLCRK